MSNSNKNRRKSVNLLPSYFQTNKNTKFLSGALDPLYSVPSLTRFNGFVGSKLSPTYNSLTDVYVNNSNISSNELRNKYQFEPALINQDSLGNIKNVFGIDDLVNQLSFYGANTSNFNKLFSPDVNSYYPHIDWDKFVNFQNYYWLPYGPDTIKIIGQAAAIESTYTVTVERELSNNEYLFTPNGFTRNPVLTLYRGQTYTFEITSPGNPFSIKTARSLGANDRYETSNIDNYAVENGTITFNVPLDAPTLLFYQSE